MRTSNDDHGVVRNGRAALGVIEHCTNPLSASRHGRGEAGSRRTIVLERLVLGEDVDDKRLVPASKPRQPEEDRGLALKRIAYRAVMNSIASSTSFTGMTDNTGPNISLTAPRTYE